MKSTLLALATMAAVLSSGMAQAGGLIGQAPDPSIIVHTGNYEWVYASPCAGLSPSCGVVQLHDGFDFATDQQWNASFANLDALIAAFALPNGGAKCAAPYFSLNYNHCDFSDVGFGYVWHSPLASDYDHWSNSAAETFLVRELAVPAGTVPEPATLALFSLGLLALAASRRKSARQ